MGGLYGGGIWRGKLFHNFGPVNCRSSLVEVYLSRSLIFDTEPILHEEWWPYL